MVLSYQYNCISYTHTTRSLSNLSQAHTITQCGHHFCLLCIREHVTATSQCPTCHKTISLLDVKKDERYDHLLDYVQQLKRSLLHEITPLEYSFQMQPMSQVETSNDVDESNPDNPLIETMNNGFDQNMDRTGWICVHCQYLNQTFFQTCGLCHEYKDKEFNTYDDDDEQLEKHLDVLEISRVHENIPIENTTLSGPKRRKLNKNIREVHILYTGLTPEDETSIDATMKKTTDSTLKIYVHYNTRDFNEITHIITSVNEHQLCRRTLKYLQGILCGRWIVDPRWLINSMQINQWLSEDEYEVKGDHVTGITHAPFKGRERVRIKYNPLFSHLRFYFSGEFSGKHNKSDLLRLCRMAEAKILNRKPVGVDHRVDPMDHIDVNEPIVIACSERKNTPNWMGHCQVRDPSWIIECISKHEIV